MSTVWINGHPFYLPHTSPRTPESPMPVECAATPQESERRGVRSA